MVLTEDAGATGGDRHRAHLITGVWIYQDFLVS